MTLLYHEIRKGGNSKLIRNKNQKWVFLHGLMGFGRNWLGVVQKMSAQDEILMPDLRGHGKSFQAPLGQYGLDDYVADLNFLVEKLQWSSFIVVGHSMGGRIALHWAHKNPERFEGLVLEDIGPDPKPDPTGFFKRLFQEIPTPFSSLQEAKRFLLEDFANNPDFQDAGGRSLALFLLTNIHESPQGWTWRFQPEAMLETLEKGRRPSQWSLWETLTCPALVIRGSLSQVLSREVFEKMLQTCRKCQGVEIPRSGHWVHAQAPEAFVTALNSWYENLVT